MKKIISILTIISMIMSFIPVFAEESAFPVWSCAYDTYISGKNYKEADTNSKKAIALTGDAYDRTAFFEFDISEGLPENAKGAILTLTARSADSGVSVELFGCESVEDFGPFSEIISVYQMENSGKNLCQFSVIDYLSRCIAKGQKTALFAVRTPVGALPLFTTEASLNADKPNITFTDVEAYIRGSRDAQFPNITRAMLASDIRKMQAGSHPYLFARKADFDRVREDIHSGKSEYLTKLYEGVKKTATEYLDAPVTEISDLNVSYLADGFNSWYIVSKCALVYQIDGDERYAQRAYDEAAYWAGLDNLGTKQALDRSQSTFALALAYDWLYDWMDQEQRDNVKNCLIEHHFNELSEFFKHPDLNDTYMSGYTHTSNQGVMNHTSSVVCAMAIADDDNVDYYADIIYNHLKYAEVPFELFFPDGGWVEGSSYWSFVGPWIARMFAAFDKAFGTYYGYDKISAMVNTGDWQMYTQSNEGFFIVQDSTFGASEKNSEKYYFAVMKDDDELKKTVISYDNPVDDPFLCLWFDTDLDHKGEINYPLDKHFRNVDMSIFRDTWKGDQELYAAMSVTAASAPHCHMATGSIGIDALGERWVTNHGNESYSVPGYWEDGQEGRRWRYYATRPEANSCLVINPSELGGQNVYTTDYINRFASNDAGGYSWANLTDTYADQVTDYVRAFGIINDRRTIVMQDEVKLIEPSLVYSFINFYMSDFEIADDQKSVIVSKGNKKMLVNIICDQPYELSVMRSVPLPTSNLLPGSKRNTTVKKLAFKFDNVSEINMRVEFTPYLFDEDISDIKNSEFIPVSEWKLPETSKTKPVLSSMKFDGKDYADFVAENRCYELPAGSKLPNVDAIADTNLYKVETTKVSDTVCKIIVTDKNDSSNTNSYIVYVAETVEPENVVDVTGYSELKISGVSATADDGNVPSNTIDGDTTTRWSASGEHSITFTLDKEKTAKAIAIYFNSSNRHEYFDLEVSLDGKTWETAGVDLESAMKKGFQYFDLGERKVKYVRYKGYGNNTNLWNSLAEVKIYGK